MSDAIPDGWTRDGEAITTSFRFPDFVAAFGFMTQVAIEAERRNHHPEWSNVYGRVDVRLTTHDAAEGAGALTDLDIELATVMNRLAARSAD